MEGPPSREFYFCNHEAQTQPAEVAANKIEESQARQVSQPVPPNRTGTWNLRGLDVPRSIPALVRRTFAAESFQGSHEHVNGNHG
jgi:hypothetical protein